MKKDDVPHLDEQLAYLAQVRDEDIDFSDIPEITSLSSAVRGKFHRPCIEEPNMQIDEDTLAWFRERFPHYQEAINGILRHYIASQSQV